MNRNSEQRTFWRTFGKGWMLSILLGLVILLIRFKAVVPIMWQMLVKDGTIHSIGNDVDRSLPFVAILGGCILLIFALRTGYCRTVQALELNGRNVESAGNAPSDGSVAFRSILRITLFINAPVIYWAVFLFILLPQLVKLPNTSLRIGNTSALAVACIIAVLIAIVATHIGLTLTKFAFRSMKLSPGQLDQSYDIAAANQPAIKSQQGIGYAQSVAAPNSQSTGMPNVPNSYAQPLNYSSPNPQANVPARPQNSDSSSAYTQASGNGQDTQFQTAHVDPNNQPVNPNNATGSQTSGQAGKTIA